MSNIKGNDGNLMQHWVLCELLANVWLQLSTYDTNDGNGQNAVAECIRSRRDSGGFEEAEIVKPNAKMMSLLYQRRGDLCAELASLACRFRTSFDAIERRS